MVPPESSNVAAALENPSQFKLGMVYVRMLCPPRLHEGILEYKSWSVGPGLSGGAGCTMR